MLAFTKKLTVTRPVTINVPKEGGGFEPATCLVTWEIVPSDDERTKLPQEEFFKAIITNLQDLQDAQTKQPITFTKEFLADFVAVDYVRSGLQREYFNCTVGAGRGN